MFQNVFGSSRTPLRLVEPSMRAASVILLLALAACSNMPPGQDARGAEMRFAATPVLEAIGRFKHDRERYPSSLYELIPDYLSALPKEPGVHFDQYIGVAEFYYSPEWPPNTRYVCTATLEAPDWVCKTP